MKALIREFGHARVGSHRPDSDACQWWYFWQEEDGWAFARGGTCATAREARHLLRSCHAERERERKRFLSRPEAEVLDDGSLRPIERGYRSV